MSDSLTSQGVDRLCEMRSRYPAKALTVDGLEWRVRDTCGDGPILLFLPGGLGNADIFYKQLLSLPPQIHCIAVDYPEAELPIIAEGLVGLLDALSLDRVSLLGSSLAGYWLQIFAARHPQRITALLLANSFSHSNRLREHPLFSISVLMKTEGEALKSEWLAMLDARPADELRDVQIKLLRDGQSGEGLRRRLLLAATAPHVQKLAGQRFPQYILDCEDDPILDTATRQDLAAHMPKAARLTLAKGGHYPSVTQAEAYNNFIIDAIGTDL